MNINEEQTFGVIPVVMFLTVLALLLFQPWQIGMKELYWQEGLFATESTEMQGFFSGVRAHGRLIGTGFPLIPYLTGLLHEIGLPVEFSLRFLSVLPAAGIAFWVFMLGRSAGGVTCGGIAATVWLTANIVMEKSLDGYPEMGMIFFVCGGQFIWFSLGQRYNRWNEAWIYSSIFGVLAFFTAGFPALIYYLVPFVFQRRPLSIMVKLKKGGAAIGGSLLLLAIVVWSVPFHLSTQNGFVFVDVNSLSGYYSHLLTFPVDAVWRLLPWSLIAWPVFCAAFRPLDPTPIFSRFLRTMTISSFFILWFSPFTEVRDIALIMPSLSILIAINYSMLVRRHGHIYRKILRPVPYLVVITGMVTAAFFLLNDETLSIVSDYVALPLDKLAFRSEFLFRIQGFVSGGVIFLIGLYLLIRRRQVPLWVAGALMMLAPMLFVWSAARPFSAQSRPKNELALEMRRALEGFDAKNIYKLNIAGLYGECYYLGIPVISISSLSEVPSASEEVFLLSTGFPQLPERGWTKLMDTKLVDASADEKSLQLYVGRLVKNRENVQ